MKYRLYYTNHGLIWRRVIKIGIHDDDGSYISPDHMSVPLVII